MCEYVHGKSYGWDYVVGPALQWCVEQWKIYDNTNNNNDTLSVCEAADNS